MILKSFLAFLFIFSLKYAQSQTAKGITGEKTVYIINYAWHTGFVIPVDSSLIADIPLIKDFSHYKYVDIGWGDEDFYQLDEFQLYEGLKALLVPTDAALRIEGYNLTIEQVAKYIDRVQEIKIDESGFTQLKRFINSYSKPGKEGNYKLLSKKSDGRIAFYAANGNYHLYNTCNTWIAKGLKQCGFKINPANVVTEEDIFREIKNFGRKLK